MHDLADARKWSDTLTADRGREAYEIAVIATRRAARSRFVFAADGLPDAIECVTSRKKEQAVKKTGYTEEQLILQNVLAKIEL